ncbi:LRR receptor-like serine threonine-protein kinase [Seminavis robusta]|uniref:LRR receptor-like serine threonine-protein kinase n=1 Tax=Seminavis robusta TaxID=568900 RepID=A0A9N8DS40_9STRA|nr:LRR receptor-like serine threonine-protein kinase [Seminavis robusta]|eukprot:Sro213_g088480.1 LRR receptor-like serine threonine-protein kinase (770) ;mRNA; f:49493-51909
MGVESDEKSVDAGAVKMAPSTHNTSIAGGTHVTTNEPKMRTAKSEVGIKSSVNTNDSAAAMVGIHYEGVVEDLQRRGLHRYADALLALSEHLQEQEEHAESTVASKNSMAPSAQCKEDSIHPDKVLSVSKLGAKSGKPGAAQNGSLVERSRIIATLLDLPDDITSITAVVEEGSDQSGIFGSNLPRPTQDVAGSSNSAPPLNFTQSSFIQLPSANPGAFNVVPSSANPMQEVSGSITIGGSVTVGTKGEPSSIQLPPTEETTLEAVRVDDILTVHADPMDGKEDRNINQKKVLKAWLGSGFCFLVGVMLLIIALTTTKNKNNETMTPVPAVTPSPTFAPDDRFDLLRDFFVSALAPYYSQGDDTGDMTNGTDLVQLVFHHEDSPRYKALEWMAWNDTEIETAIPLDYITFMDLPAGHNNHDTKLPDESQQRLLQRFALAAFYFATGGPTAWSEQYEFLAPGHECDWSGALQCSEVVPEDDDAFTLESNGGRNQSFSVITGIDLKENGLTGSLTQDLGALSHLKSINLFGNALTGTFPASLAHLTALTDLTVANNRMDGTIPETCLASWMEMQSLKLGDNSFSGTLPSEIGLMVNLVAFGAERLSWQGTVPKELFQKLTNLEFLEMSNMVYGFVNDTLPTHIGLWTNLKSLIMHGSNLVGSIPIEIGLVSNLKRLQLASNHMTGPLPSELGLLTAMTRLQLSVNGLTGTVPTSFVNFESVKRLELQNTLLTGDVSFLCNAIEAGNMTAIDNFRMDMAEVSGCSCCSCCEY